MQVVFAGHVVFVESAVCFVSMHLSVDVLSVELNSVNFQQHGASFIK